MSKIFCFFAMCVLFCFSISEADVFVNGYYRSNGTYVQPYYRSSPDGTTLNNWSTQGNINPYTGSLGTRPGDYRYVPSVPTY